MTDGQLTVRFSLHS